MPRIARGLVDGFIYHVLNRGNGRQEIFHREKDYEAFINLMEKAKERYFVRIFAYCLMPNHFHMVLIIDRDQEIPQTQGFKIGPLRSPDTPQPCCSY